MKKKYIEIKDPYDEKPKKKKAKEKAKKVEKIAKVTIEEEPGRAFEAEPKMAFEMAPVIEPEAGIEEGAEKEFREGLEEGPKEEAPAIENAVEEPKVEESGLEIAAGGGAGEIPVETAPTEEADDRPAGEFTEEPKSEPGPGASFVEASEEQVSCEPEPEPIPVPELETKLATESELAPEPELAPALKSETEIESGIEIEPELKPEPEQEPALELEPEPEPAPALAPAPASAPTPAQELEPEPEPAPAPEPEPEPEPAPAPVSAPAPEPAPESIPAPEPERATVPVPAPAPEPAFVSELEPLPVPVFAPEPEIELKSEAEIESVAEIEPEPELAFEIEPKSETEIESAIKPEPEPEPDTLPDESPDGKTSEPKAFKLPILIAAAAAALVIGLLIGAFLLGGVRVEGTAVTGKAVVDEAGLDSPIASYTYGGSNATVTVREVIEKSTSLEAARDADGNYQVPTADSALGVVRNKLIVAEAEKLGISVTDEEVAQYASNALGTDDYEAIAAGYGMTVEAVENLMRESCLMSKLRETVVTAAEATLPDPPAEPASTDAEAASKPDKKYADYIIALVGDEWDAAKGTWASKEGPYASTLAGAYEITPNGATYEAAVAAYYIAYQLYSQEATTATAQWTDYVNGILSNATIKLYNLSA